MVCRTGASGSAALQLGIQDISAETAAERYSMSQITVLLWFGLCKELLLEQFIVTSSDGGGVRDIGQMVSGFEVESDFVYS